jgi:citrate lyase subunit beta / citryl-CoA lyase
LVRRSKRNEISILPLMFAHRLDALRSLLFVPASDERRIATALASGAGAVIVDLEDAVAEREKAAARAALPARLRDAGVRDGVLTLVRVNGLRTPHAAEDLAMLREAPVDGVVVPKAEPEDLGALPAEAPPAIALVETALGIRRAYETARLPAVAALMLGTVDLAAELGADPALDPDALRVAASSLVLDAVAAGLGGPIDGVCTALGDTRALRAQSLRAKALGYRAKACIHPAQLPVVHEVFSPSEAELAQARATLAAYEEALRGGRGATTLDGELIDAPIAARAARLLALNRVGASSA